MIVSGTLTANGTTLNGNANSSLAFTSTGAISGTANIFNLSLIVPYAS